jgi:hypothetical protein
MANSGSARRVQLTRVWFLSIAMIAVGAMPILGKAEESAEPKSIRKTCGTCPDGYALTGLTSAPDICKGEDPTLVQCVPLGANLLPICGSCPEGYHEIGRSSLPARCGTQDGGRLTQCQLLQMEPTLPDPTQGFTRCPPDCGSPATPGQGALPPPPSYRPPPDK